MELERKVAVDTRNAAEVKGRREKNDREGKRRKDTLRKEGGRTLR